jgi:hypothetical protein
MAAQRKILQISVWMWFWVGVTYTPHIAAGTPMVMASLVGFSPSRFENIVLVSISSLRGDRTG